MSLFFALILIAIAWLMSSFIDGIPHVWHLTALAPRWLEGALVLGLLAWFVSDP
jgi:hypothetical protein